MKTLKLWVEPSKEGGDAYLAKGLEDNLTQLFQGVAGVLLTATEYDVFVKDESSSKDEKRWNIVEVVENQQKTCYRDYEGLTRGPEAEILKKKVAENVASMLLPESSDDYIRAVCDVTLNLVYEMLDEYDTELSDDEIGNIAYAVSEMLSTKYWTKSGVNWKIERKGMDVKISEGQD